MVLRVYVVLVEHLSSCSLLDISLFLSSDPDASGLYFILFYSSFFIMTERLIAFK